MSVEAVEGPREFEGRAVAQVAVVEFAVAAYGGDDMRSPRVVEAESGADLVGLAGKDLECGVEGWRRRGSLRCAALRSR